MPHFQFVFSLPAQIADIAYHNKAVIYDILFKASTETMITIAADPKHLGARIGIQAGWEEAPVRHETARVHRVARGSNGFMAVRCTRAAVDDAAAIGSLGSASPTPFAQMTAAFDRGPHHPRQYIEAGQSRGGAPLGTLPSAFLYAASGQS